MSLTNRLPFWVPLLEPWARAEKIGPTPIRPAIMYQYKKKKSFLWRCVLLWSEISCIAKQIRHEGGEWGWSVYTPAPKSYWFLQPKTESAIDEGNVGLYKQVTFIYNQSQQIKRRLIYKSFAFFSPVLVITTQWNWSLKKVATWKRSRPSWIIHPMCNTNFFFCFIWFLLRQEQSGKMSLLTRRIWLVAIGCHQLLIRHMAFSFLSSRTTSRYLGLQKWLC